MRIDTDLVLNASEATLALPEFKGFAEALKRAFIPFSEKAPSNSAFRVDVHVAKDGYKVAIDLASGVLNFNEVGEGHSPFTALDRVLVKAKRNLELWSVQKNINPPSQSAEVN